MREIVWNLKISYYRKKRAREFNNNRPADAQSLEDREISERSGLTLKTLCHPGICRRVTRYSADRPDSSECRSTRSAIIVAISCRNS